MQMILSHLHGEVVHANDTLYLHGVHVIFYLHGEDGHANANLCNIAGRGPTPEHPRPASLTGISSVWVPGRACAC